MLATAALLAPSTAVIAQSQPAPQPASTPAPKPAEPAKPANGERATSVEGVTVTADPNTTRTSIDRRSYSVATDLQAQTGSISDALRNVPGVQVDVQGAVTLRGSGVTILVDGKPSAMFSGEGQADALLAMPADQIERVEVMTNPSAEFSPEGRGGIINLVTKPNRRRARTATVRANLGDDGRYNGGISASLMNGPLTLSANAGLRRNIFEYSSETDRSSLDPLTGLFADSRDTFRGRNENLSGQARLGAEYDLDPQSRLSGEFRYSLTEYASAGQQTREGEDADGAVVSAFERLSAGDGSWGNAGGSLRYRRQYEGDQHDLTLALTYDRQWSDLGTRATINFAVPALPPLYELIGSESVTNTTRLTVDYNRPLPGDQRLKVGADFKFSDKGFDFRGERGAGPGSTVVDPALTNRFQYGLNTQAVYFTYQRPIGPVTAQLGLRVEADQEDIDQLTSGLFVRKVSTGLYPTLHLQYELTDTQQLTGSYSRRIQRPGPGALNPYVIYIDPFNQRSGNPNLRPEVTDSWELGWQYQSGSTLYVVTAYLRDTYDGVTEVTRDIGGGVFLSTQENLTASRDGGLEASASGKIGSKLTYQLYGDVHYEEIDGSSLIGTQDQSGVTYFANATLNWQVTPDDFLQVSGFAWGPSVSAQGERSAGGGVNLGYRHKFNEDLSLVFTAQDLLDTVGHNESTLNTPLLRSRNVGEFGAQSFYLGLTWSFGNGPRRQQPSGFEFENSGGAGPPGG